MEGCGLRVFCVPSLPHLCNKKGFGFSRAETPKPDQAQPEQVRAYPLTSAPNTQDRGWRVSCVYPTPRTTSVANLQASSRHFDWWSGGFRFLAPLRLKGRGFSNPHKAQVAEQRSLCLLKTTVAASVQVGQQPGGEKTQPRPGEYRARN